MKALYGYLLFSLLMLGCQSGMLGPGEGGSGVEVPPDLWNRSQKGLAMQVLTSREVTRSGWSVVAIEDESIRVRQSTPTQVTTVDVYFEEGRLIPVLTKGYGPTEEAPSRPSFGERMRMRDLLVRMERAIAMLEAREVAIQG